ncbi:hypothetical protein GCM10009789_10580 [Kribbella sancticallisti]|uniref:Uncharacterized protein n=1 Tax=Kribbella sancticallisti TaxID=460087 RepID=A0ABP4NEH4_9ACTN
MTDSPETDRDDDTGPEKFRHLPPAVKLEDTIATHDPDPEPDPELGGDTQTEFTIRYSG